MLSYYLRRLPSNGHRFYAAEASLWWLSALAAGGILGIIVAPSVSAHTCGTPTSCIPAGGTCLASCSESDVRQAVAVLNQCGTDGAKRTLKFSFGSCGCNPCACTIPFANTDSTASCGGIENFTNAICLTADNLTIDGSNAQGTPSATFKYAGPYPCASCSGSCTGPQPALFAVLGSNDTIKNVALQFFPEGIHIRRGDHNTLSGVVDQFYCEDALTIDGGTNHAIQGSTLVGSTDPAAGNTGHTCYKERLTPAGQKLACNVEADCPGTCSQSGGVCTASADCPNGETCATPIAGQHCHCNATGLWASDPASGGTCQPSGGGTCYRPALCGLDKAIQINAGTGLHVDNTSFVNTLTPVLVSDGLGPSSATIETNQVTGSQADLTLGGDPTFKIAKQQVCDGPAASGPSATATFRGNSIQYCKFGIRSRAGATVHTEQNTVKNDYVSAFEIEGAGTLTGSFNRMKDNGTLPATPADPVRGAIVVLDDVNAHVDFGSRVSGGELGLNVFCGGLGDVWDRVQPCSSACCAAAVSAERNCFEMGTNIVDPSGINGLVDFAYHGRVGIDPLCLDYGLACGF
jgi:hypothetical protein